MNRGIYSAATGMVAAQRWMDITANNLANTSTNGFKRDVLSFTDTFQSELIADGGRGPRIGSLGYGPTTAVESTDMSIGSQIITNNPKDFSIMEPEQMFAVQGDQGVQYTRNGSFRLNQNNQLVTQRDELVLDANLRPISIDPATQVLNPDGTVSEGGTIVSRIGIFTGFFEKVGGVNFVSQDASVVPSPRLLQGSIEGSNVSAIESMIDMIRINRHFELSQKSIQSQDELTQKLIQSLQR
jgi:flagellar basal-body rod protein FlgF